MSESHMSQRMRQRFGEDFDAADHDRMAKMIRERKGNVRVIKRSTQIMLTVEVPWNGRNVIVLYNETTGTLITALRKAKLPPRQRFPQDKRTHRPNKAELRDMVE